MRQKFISVFLCFALSFLVLSPSYLSPKKADAIAPAIPIVVGVGAVVASALAAYGIQSVNSDRSTGDIGTSFISWITSKDLDDFWDAQTDIKSAQAAINAIYQMGIDGSISLGQWTYNEQNAIYGTYGALMQMWAADGFAALPPVSGGGVSVSGIDISTFHTDMTPYDAIPNSPSYYDKRPYYAGFSINGDYIVFNTISQNYADSGLKIILGTNGSWTVTDYSGLLFGGIDTQNLNNSSSISVQINSSPMSYYYSSGLTDLSDIAFNTYYNIKFYYIDSDINSMYQDYRNHITGNPSISTLSLTQIASYTANSGVWDGDVSIDTGIEGDIFDKFSDALNKGINDLLSQEIPVASDMVYNPSLQALEGQGSIPVTYDWSQVLDWADVLNGTRAGTLDGSQSIDGTTSTIAVNTASGTLSTDIALDTALDTPYLSITPNIGSIGGAMGYAGGQMLDKFPFCTIRDLQALADFMNSPAQAPYFDLPIVVVDNGSLDVVIQRVSLAQWEPVAVVLRFMIGLLIILGFLRVATRQLKIFNEE